MQIHQVVVGLYQVNSYIIENDEALVIVDPGARANKLAELVEQLAKPVKAILLTHAHFDHIGAVDQLVKLYQCPVYLNQADYEMAIDPVKNHSLPDKPTKLKTKPVFFKEGLLEISSFEFKIMFAPGHSAGSTLIEIDNYLFTGDVLFKGSIGRTDLSNSNPVEMRNTLNDLRELPMHLTILPGHGPSSTIQLELMENPYLC